MFYDYQKCGEIGGITELIMYLFDLDYQYKIKSYSNAVDVRHWDKDSSYMLTVMYLTYMVE